MNSKAKKKLQYLFNCLPGLGVSPWTSKGLGNWLKIKFHVSDRFLFLEIFFFVMIILILIIGEGGTSRIRERKAVKKCRGFVGLLSGNELATEDLSCRQVCCHAVVFSYIDTLLNDAVSTVTATGVRSCTCTENFEGRRNKRVWLVLTWLSLEMTDESYERSPNRRLG